MYLKIIRPYYRFGESKCEYKLEESNYYRNIMSENILLGENFSKRLKSDQEYYYMIILLLEVGKIWKKDLISEDGVTIQKIVLKGIEKYSVESEDIEDNIYLSGIKKVIENLKNGDGILDITIYRDSTASSLQH
jgi:hypothetical protein